MNTVLFINPPWWSAGDDLGDGKFQLRRGVRAGSRWPFTLNATHKPDEFKFGGYIPFPYFLSSAAAWARYQLPNDTIIFRDSIARGESYKAFNDFWVEAKPTHVILETGAASWEHDKKYIGMMKSSVAGLKVAVAGPPARDLSKTTEPGLVDAWLLGEYEKNAVKFVQGTTGILEFDLLSKNELYTAPYPLIDFDAGLNYWDCNPLGATAPQMQLITSRGCAFACIAGDTPIDTVEGRFPIRELVGKKIGVFTYDPKTRRAKVATGRRIQQYGEEELVRVKFDDGTHIDCTPDHEFLTFKVGRRDEPEVPRRADELVPGMHLRALKFSPPDIGGYIDAQWARRGRTKSHRLVAAWKIGRDLKDEEHVHHIDHVKTNNHPDNLEVCANAKEHLAKHPEVAERMRTNNPTKFGMSAEWRENMSKANKGKVRTVEARERYRLAAIKREAAKSPEQKRIDDERMLKAYLGTKAWLKRNRDLEGKFEPNGIINHRVVSVERLEGVHPVYCMEVPDTGWFYANNVLVSNCKFCSWVHTMSADDPTGEKPHPVRFYDAAWVAGYIRDFITRFPETKSLLIDDDCFNISARHVKQISAVLKQIGLPWSAMCRADTIGRETWQVMKDSGCFGVKIGFESASQRVIDEVINKKLDLKKAEETCKWLRSIGLFVHTTWTIGSPGETAEEMQLTLDTIQRFYAEGVHDTHQLSGTAEIPGTPLATQEKNDPNYVSSPDGAKKLNLIANK